MCSAGSAEEASPRAVLNVVSQPAEPNAFPGLYATTLPERPFLGDGSAVLVNTQWGNRRCTASVKSALPILQTSYVPNYMSSDALWGSVANCNDALSLAWPAA